MSAKTINMFQYFPKLLLALMLTSASIFSTGCVAILAGGAAAGGTAYVMGELKVDIEATPAQIRSAITGAGDELNLRSISGAGDEIEGEYTFRTAGDEKVTIRYEVKTDNFAELRIRVGTFGDRSKSVRINDAIQNRL